MPLQRPPPRAPTFPLYESYPQPPPPAPPGADAAQDAGGGAAADTGATVDLSALAVGARVSVGVVGEGFRGEYHGTEVVVRRVSVAGVPVDAVKVFMREVGRVCALPSHPALQAIYGVVGEEGAGAVLVVGEAFAGGWLRDVLGAGGGGAAELASWAVQVAVMLASGLKMIHDAGIVHGDLGAGCVGVRDGGVSGGGVCLSDYGLSLAVAEMGRARDVAAGGGGRGWLTRSGGCSAGSAFQYFPPEAGAAVDSAAGGAVAVGQAADMYALGVLLWEVRTGERAWHGVGMAEVRHRVAQGERPAWPDEVGEADGVRRAAEMCWRQDAAARTSAAAVCEMLEGEGEPCGGLGMESVSVDEGVVEGVVARRARQLEGGRAGRGDAAGSGGASVFHTCRAAPPAEAAADGTACGTSPLTTDTEAARGHGAAAAEDVKRASTDRRNLLLPREHRSPGYAASAASSTQLLFSAEQATATAAMRPSMLEDRRDPAVPLSTVDAVQSVSTASLTPSIAAGILQASAASAASVASGASAASAASREGSTNINLVGTAEWNDMLDAVRHGRDREDEGVYDLPPVLPRDNSKLSASGSTIVAPMVVSERSKERRRTKRLEQLFDIIAESGVELLRMQQHPPPPSRRRGAARTRLSDEFASVDDGYVLEGIRAAAAAQDTKKLLDFMRARPESPAVAREVVKEIGEIARVDEARFRGAVEENAIDELMGAVARHEKDEAVCASYCRAIISFSRWYADDVGHLLRALGVPTMVVSVMDGHKQSKEIQTEGCHALAAICDTGEMNRSTCASLRGPFALHFAMSRNLAHWKDRGLAVASLSAFRAVAHENADACSALLKVCALDSVARTAEVFSNDDLEPAILAALESVVFYTDGREELIKANGVHAIATIMLRENEPEFVRRCCRVVTDVCQLRLESCERELLSSAIAERIVVALRATTSVAGELAAGVAFEATQAIVQLASFGAHLQDQCALVGAIDAVFHVLHARMNDPQCVMICARAFRMLLNNNAGSLINARCLGVAGALHKALERHAARALVADELHRALYIFAAAEPRDAPGPSSGRLRLLGRQSRASRPAAARAPPSAAAPSRPAAPAVPPSPTIRQTGKLSTWAWLQTKRRD